MMRGRRSLFALCLLALAALGLTLACRGGEEPTGTPTIPTIVLSPLPSPIPSPVTPTPKATPSSLLDLAEASPLAVLLAGDADDMLMGIPALAVGDFNDDGVDDLLIGAPFADGPDNSREDGGEAYVMLGGSDLAGEIDLLPGSVDTIIYGALPGDNLGFSVAAGDLNADGIDDIVVGAPASNGLENIRTDLGEAYVIFGKQRLPQEIDIAEEEQDVTLRGAEGFARVGTSFAIGDVNRDKRDDLVAGAPFAGRQPGTPPGGPRTTVGEVYVVFGGRDLKGLIDVAADQQDFTLAGSEEFDTFGQAVAVADLNADGSDDILVGAPGADGPDNSRQSAGEAFLFLGARQLAGKWGVDEAHLAIVGADAGDGLGEGLAVGDFDGDRKADVLMLARAGDGPLNDREGAGEAYLFFGSRFRDGTRDLQSEAADVVIYGIDASDLLATGVLAFDLDRDRKDDIVLGLPLAASRDDQRRVAGEVYVLFGKALQEQLDLRQSAEGFLFIYGAAADDGLGSGVTIGDLNDDGRFELVAVAPGAQGPDGRRGKIYILPAP